MITLAFWIGFFLGWLHADVREDDHAKKVAATRAKEIYERDYGATVNSHN